MAGLSITTKNPLEFITVAARVDNVITSSMVMADIKFAVRLSVCLSVRDASLPKLLNGCR